MGLVYLWVEELYNQFFKKLGYSKDDVKNMIF